jgi:hypothetical protein
MANEATLLRRAVVTRTRGIYTPYDGGRADYNGQMHGTKTARMSRMPEEPQVESPEHQDDANIRHQPFQESVSKEQQIYTDDDGCHCHHVKRDNYPAAHFSFLVR